MTSHGSTNDSHRSSGALPLAGVRVVESSQVLAGAMAGMVLADLGASVVKVERPRVGDASRSFGPPFIDESAYYFHAVNRNKRSIALDLRDPASTPVLRRLIERSDVFVHNHLAADAERLGLTEGRLREWNPELVFVEIRAHEKSTRREVASLDMLVQAETGSMWLTGMPDGTPAKAAVPVADICAGLFGVISALAGLTNRLRGHVGGSATAVSLYNSVLAAMPFHWAQWVLTGAVPDRMGNGHPTIVPYNVYETGSGDPVALAVVSAEHWRALVSELDLTDALPDQEFDANPYRVANRDRVDKAVAEAFAHVDASEVVPRLQARGLAVAITSRVPSRMRTDGSGPEGFVRVQASNGGGSRPLMVPGPAFHSDDWGPSPEKMAPRLGEHSDEVARWLDFSETERHDLFASGVLGRAPVTTESDS